MNRQTIPFRSRCIPDSFIAQIALISCKIDNPPSAPSGLYSITGDGEVTLYWALNPEPDLKEFALYTSDEEFGVYSLDGITEETYYTFYFLNGVTQYMAVTAIDFAGRK